MESSEKRWQRISIRYARDNGIKLKRSFLLLKGDLVIELKEDSLETRLRN
jgi:hypothetical protein